MIFRVAVRQFARTLRVWVGVLVVAAVAAMLTCASFLQIATAQTLEVAEQRAILSLAYGQTAFTLIATLIIAGSTAVFAVAATRTDLARLQLAGVSPVQVIATVSLQAACASVMGAVVGGALGIALAQSWLDSTVAFTPINRAVPVSIAATNVLAAVAVVIVVMVLGAIRAAIAAARAPAVQAVRGNSDTRIRRWVNGGRLIAAVASGAVAAALAAGLMTLNGGGDRPLDERDLSLVVGLSVLFVIALLAFAAITAGIVVPLVITIWTVVVPASWSLPWHLARSGLRRLDGRSQATAIPIMVAVTIPAALMTTFQTAGEAMGGVSASNVNVGGLLVLIAPALTIATVGAGMLILMSGTAQRTRLAMIEVLGAPPSLAVRIAFAEASIIVLTAAVIALGLVLLTGYVTSSAFAPGVGSAPVVSYGVLGIATGVAWLLVAVITILPVVFSRPRTLADALREPD